MSTRLRTGDGDPRPSRRNQLRAIIQNPTDECIIWPHALSMGYPVVRHEGRQWGGHALVCHWTHGPRPDGDIMAAHSCGIKACVNPLHIRWATRQENADDAKRLHEISTGVDHPGAKLTDDDVRDIRTSYAKGGVTQRQLAEKYRVGQSHISEIVRGVYWKYVA